MKKNFCSKISSLLFPRWCIFCGEESPGSLICRQCLHLLEHEIIHRPCRICGKELLSEKELCTDCRVRWSEEAPLFGRNRALFIYRGRARELISAYKFHNRKELSFPIAVLINRSLNSFTSAEPKQLDQPLQLPILVPVPFRKAGKRERGWDPVALICSHLSRSFGWRVYSCLNRKGNKEQKKMSREERLINMQHRISFKPPKKRIDIEKTDPLILLDDVFTTGATLSACAKVLREQGFSDITTITIVVD
jgi:ComF family protein